MAIQNNPTPGMKQTVQNPLDEKKNLAPGDDIVHLYGEQDKEYLSFLTNRLVDAKRQKDQPYPEWGWKNYYTIHQENEDIANTVLPAKKNDDDVIVSAGTVEQKLVALLSNVNNLNLDVDFFAYDADNTSLEELGIAITDIVRDTEEQEEADNAGDEEKKILRQLELMKQGTAFVQEEWLRKFEMKKKLKGKYNGEFKMVDGWTESLEKVFEGPSRNLLYGPNVFLGNVFEFYMDNQPYVFTLMHQDYNTAKARFGNFENWKYVKEGNFVDQAGVDIYDMNWRLTNVKEHQVEVIMYQDKFRDEFQIIINGILMMPIGFPLSAVSPGGGYNIAKQVFRVINAKFAYGKAFVASGSVKELSSLIDEMLRLGVLKNRKSFAPPYVNNSGRVVSSRVLSPGRITMGIAPDALTAIGDQGQGITNSEVVMLQNLQELVDKSTVSDTFAGQQSQPGTTATEVLQQQKQAELTLGLTVAACALMEKKLAYLRLYNVLANWFEPVGQEVVALEATSVLVNNFRTTNRKVSIPGEGMGERQIIPTDGPLPDSQSIRHDELIQKKLRGVPVRKIYVSSEHITDSKYIWKAVINPQEKASSPYFKSQFRDMMNDVIGLVNMGAQPNLSALEEEFGKVWQKPTTRFFMPPQPAAQQMPPGMTAGSEGPPQQTGGPAPANARSVPGRANAKGVPSPASAT